MVYLHPGVYVEEISGGARPIEAAGTSTAAFVGIAEKGPIDEPRFVTNFTEFQQIYGGYVSDANIGKSYLAYSVFQFFQNGGSSCYVVRVEDDVETAELDLKASDGGTTTTVQAVSPGSWGNDLSIGIGPPTVSEDGFNLYILKGDEILETHEDLSMVDSSNFYVDRVTKESLYIRTTSSTTRSDKPTFTGRVDLSGDDKDLSNVSRIKLQIDNVVREIDCAKDVSDDSNVTASQIIANINAAFADDFTEAIASKISEDGKDYIRIDSPTATEESQIIFTAPSEKDATYDIFGLQESSWEVKSQSKTMALTYGLGAYGLPTADVALTMALGEGLPVTVTIPATTTLMEAVKLINVSTLGEIAYTDGAHLILMVKDKDITIRRPDAASRTGINEIFGTEFYSYVHEETDPEKTVIIKGEAMGTGNVHGQLKLKIDKVKSFIVDIDATTGSATDNAAEIAANINEAYQKASKSKKKIAASDGDQVVVNSIATGTDGRIIVSSHTGDDMAGAIFVTAHEKNADGDDFIITAESQSIAILDGDGHLRSEGIGTDLAGQALRLSADSDPVQFTVTTGDPETFEKFLEELSTKTDLNHKLLAKVFVDGADEKISFHMVAASLTEKPFLRFSLPLTPTDVHDVTDTSRVAYARLFKGDALFDVSNLKARPEFSYRFDLLDNNPVENVVPLENELDFANVESLSGGSEDRANKNSIRDLTTGSSPGVSSGLRLLDKLTDISILVVPGWSKMTDAIAKTFIESGTSYCDKIRPAQARPLRDLFYVTNTPASVQQPTDAKDYVRNQISTISQGGYSAIYYPWITVNDPIGTESATISIPPAGSIAGLYASIDKRRGVWKAPAGTEAGVANIVKLADQVTDIKQDLLNPFSVNAIRRIPGAGAVSWGARTLHTNPEWKYVPVRRTAIMIEVSIYEAVQWAVFEPNDYRLWSTLRASIGNFMNGMFRVGAFQGEKASDAYFVRCGKGDTMTQGEIDAGQVIVIVGFAPLKPAEFVIVRIQQKVNQQ
jgi:phage tail sheath protein FI